MIYLACLPVDSFDQESNGNILLVTETYKKKCGVVYAAMHMLNPPPLQYQGIWANLGKV